ncbi:hypothetical protein [Aestuariivirga sp.]|uniref:hypothetical protein n=1 Tax=Aestuariivirga sp. TaxID=2650926 RepID=UPI0039E34DE6
MQSDSLPTGLSPPLEALWWLRKGDFAVGPEWQKAHELAQGGEGDPAYDLVHALVHWIEGDQANAAYWYRRAGGRRAPTIAEEWERAVNMLTGGLSSS